MKKTVLRLLFTVLILFAVCDISFADEAVFRKVLDNGLIVLSKEIPSNDLVSVNIAIKAGITSEEGYTASGISHFVEHMVFKGTRTRKPGDIEKEIRSYGGMLNGAVSPDITVYDVTIPRKYLANTLSLLKDMLLNASFDKDELEKERQVILKEIKLNRDDPEKRSVLSLFNNAYLRHPYKYPSIGYESLLASLTRDDLLKYYDRTYVPNRIVVSIVGDIDAKEASGLAESEFKNFRQADYRQVYRDRESPQIGKRYVEEEASTTLAYLNLGFHSTGILDRDLFALDVLSMILGRGNNSRLNATLVKDKRSAYSVSASNYTPQDPGLFIISAVLSFGNMDVAREQIMDTIKKVKDGDIGDKELEAAKKMVLADYVMSRETIEEQARDLGESEMLTGNYDFYSRYVDGIGKVTKGQVQRVAASYLSEDNLTEVALVPKFEKSSPIKIAKPRTEDKIDRTILPNGMRILIRPDAKVPVVSITVAYSGGLLSEDARNNGISNFTAGMLLKGTKTRKESEVKGAIENLGGEISSFSGFNSFGISVSVLKDDVDFALELIKDIITNPAFPQDEITAAKSIAIAAIKDEDDDIFQKGILVLRKELFGKHPYSMRNIGEAATIDSFKRDDIVKYYGTYCVPNNMVMSISGDVNKEKILKKIEGLSFKSLKPVELPKQQAKQTAANKAGAAALKMDKEQSLLMIGFKTTTLSSPDRYALDLLESVLSGMSGRLFIALRDKKALAYTLGCVQKLGTDTGYMLFYVATTKEKIDESRKALLEELKLIKSTPVSDEELLAAKKGILLGYKTMMQANSFCSLQTALDELYGLGSDNMYKYEKNINSVTKDDLKRVADKYLDLNACAEVVITPGDGAS